MELIRQIVGQLLLLSLLALLLELLLPRSGLKRPVRLVIGLFLLVTLLEPTLRLFNENWASRLQAFSGEGLPRIETALQEGERLRQQALVAGEGRLQEELARQVGAIAESITGAGVEDVEVRLDTRQGSPRLQELVVVLKPAGGETNQSVDVLARGERKNEDTRKLVQTLARLYGLDPAQIKITMGR